MHKRICLNFLGVFSSGSQNLKGDLIFSSSFCSAEGKGWRKARFLSAHRRFPDSFPLPLCRVPPQTPEDRGWPRLVFSQKKPCAAHTPPPGGSHRRSPSAPPHPRTRHQAGSGAVLPGLLLPPPPPPRGRRRSQGGSAAGPPAMAAARRRPGSWHGPAERRAAAAGGGGRGAAGELPAAAGERAAGAGVHLRAGLPRSAAGPGLEGSERGPAARCGEAAGLRRRSVSVLYPPASLGFISFTVYLIPAGSRPPVSRQNGKPSETGLRSGQEQSGF